MVFVLDEPTWIQAAKMFQSTRCKYQVTGGPVFS